MQQCTLFDLLIEMKPESLTQDEPKEVIFPLQARLGIDLSRYSLDVRRIFLKAWGYKLNRAGIDVEDALQDVYKGILIRNAGRCPFDPAKSSLGHYVWMVCNCVCLNILRQSSRAQFVEIDVDTGAGVDAGMHGLVEALHDLGDALSRGGGPKSTMARARRWLTDEVGPVRLRRSESAIGA